jgi:hypothetical protein
MHMVGLPHYDHSQKDASLSYQEENARDIFRQSFTMELCRTSLLARTR